MRFGHLCQGTTVSGEVGGQLVDGGLELVAYAYEVRGRPGTGDDVEGLVEPLEMGLAPNGPLLEPAAAHHAPTPEPTTDRSVEGLAAKLTALTSKRSAQAVTVLDV